MWRLFSSNEQGHKYFQKPSKPCLSFGIHWIAFVKQSQMSTHVSRLQSSLKLFASPSIGQISHHQQKGKAYINNNNDNNNNDNDNNNDNNVNNDNNIDNNKIIIIIMIIFGKNGFLFAYLVQFIPIP